MNRRNGHGGPKRHTSRDTARLTGGADDADGGVDARRGVVARCRREISSVVEASDDDDDDDDVARRVDAF
jgi:hypothetical protein